EVYLLESSGARAGVPQRLDPIARTLTPTAWPSAFDVWRQRVEHIETITAHAVPPALLSDALDAEAPALFVPVPRLTRMESDGPVMVVPDPASIDRTIVVWLDAGRVREPLLRTLVDRHFASALDSDYIVTIVKRDDPSQVIYASAPDAPVTPQSADLTAGLF